MKFILKVTIYLILTVTSASVFAGNNYLGKVSGKSLLISVSQDKESYKIGEKVKVKAIVTLTGRSSIEVWWDNLTGKKLKDDFIREGVDVDATFPSSATEVTSNLKIVKSSATEIEYSYESPALVSDSSSQFSLRIYNKDTNVVLLKKLTALQAKLEKRVQSLQKLKSFFRDNRALLQVIAIFDHEIEKLQKIIDRIIGSIGTNDNLMAENTSPVQLENGTSLYSKKLTLVKGFQLGLEASIGKTFERIPLVIKGTIKKAGVYDHADDFYHSAGKYEYFVEMQQDSKIVASGYLNHSSGAIDLPFNISLLKKNSNLFKITLFLTKNKKKQETIGTLELNPVVLADNVKPKWILSDYPKSQTSYLHDFPKLTITAQDDYGRLDLGSFQVNVSGSLIQNVTSLFAADRLNEGALYNFSTSSLNTLPEGLYNFSFSITDTSLNTPSVAPFTSKIVVDRTPPNISFTNPDLDLSSYPNYLLGVTLSDVSPVSSDIFVNDVLVQNIEGILLNVSVSLSGGFNQIKVVSTDAAGNVSQASTRVIFDITPPELTLDFVGTDGKIFTNHLPSSVATNVESNEPLSLVSVNGNSHNLSTDKLSASGVVSLPSHGINVVKAIGKDIAGNQSEISKNVEVIYDIVSPIVTLDYSGPLLTNSASISVQVSVSDTSPHVSTILVNGVETFQSSEANFVVPFNLDLEGENTLQVVTTDKAGNTVESSILKIQKDSIAPQLVLLTPENGTKIDRMIFNVIGSANEPLKSAEVDGKNLAISGKDFSGQYVADRNGSRILNIKLTDKAGNESLFEVNINIDDVLLVPNLISLASDFDNVHLWVVGSASAARPGAEISVSAALFGNSGETVAAEDGSFKIRLKKFTNADLTAFDSRTNEEAEMNLQFSSATSLAGTVKDVFGNPLPNVKIGFVGSLIGTYTDVSGNFIVQNPPTGDQTLVIDGGSIPTSTTGADRKFFLTKLAISVGVGQANQLGDAVFLTPLMLDGSQTQVAANAAAVVTSTYAPGVEIQIPSGVTTFPDGTKAGAINIMTVEASRATTAVPMGYVPTNVVSLEPSGLKFSKPVAIVVPNENELPAKTPMVFFSMNSAEGKWEIDGFGKVSDNGQSIESNSGSGITHFSLIYAVPLSPIIANIKNPNLLGITTTQGGLEASVQAPTYQILGKEVAPTLLYKSGWANPTAVVSNSFNIPTLTTTSSGSGTGEFNSTYEVQKKSCSTETKNYVVWWQSITTCHTFWEEWWNKLSYDFSWQATNLWIPESIKSQFFVGSTASDKVSFSSTSGSAVAQLEGTKIENAAATKILEQTGLPQSSIVSYAVELKDPGTGEYMGSGIHPALARYQIKLKNLTITTSTKTTYENFGRGGNSYVIGTRKTNYDPTTSIHETLLEYSPDDLQSNILVQNKTDSSVGRGWSIGGVQRIYNPTNSTVMIEQRDGSVATYALNSLTTTVFDAKNTGVDLKNGVDLSRWPLAIASRTNSSKDSFISQVDLTSSTVSNLNQIPNSTGALASQGYYQCNANTRCDIGGCFQEYSGQFSSVLYPFKPKASLGGLIKASNGEVFFTNLRMHGLYKNGGAQKLIGETMSIDEALATEVYSNKVFTEYFNTSGPTVSQTCNSLFGVDCEPAQVQAQRYNCSSANIVRTCTASSGMIQVVKCTYAQEPQYLFTPSVGSLGLQGSGNYGLNSPTFVVGAPDGRLIVSDTGNNRVISVDPISGTIQLVAGNGNTTDSGDGGLARNAGIYHPKGLVFDNSGNLYISTENGYIRKVTPAGQISHFAGLPLNKGGVVSDQANALTIALNNPQGMVFDSGFNSLYVADTNNNRVLQISLSNGIANKIAGTGQCAIQVAEGTPALFTNICRPTTVGMDDIDNLLIVDSGNEKIRRVTFSGYSSGALAFIPSTQDSSRLFKNSNGSWTRQYRDGSYDSFNSDGLQVSSSDKIGRVTTFLYDSQKNLTEVQYANGQKLTYSYSGGFISSILDPAGRETIVSHSGGKLSKIKFPDGTTKEYTYDSKSQMKSEKNQRGFETFYDYNAWNRLSSVRFPDGSRRTINDIASQTIANDFNTGAQGPSVGAGFGDGQVSLQLTDENAVTTEVLQDHMGFVSVVKNSLGHLTKVKRDGLGRPVEVTNAKNEITKFAYDSQTGDLLSITDVQTGIKTSATYNAKGSVLTETNGNGKVTTYSYDATTGLLLEKVTPDGIKYLTEYDSLGLVKKKTISKGSMSNSTSYTYDSLGQLSEMIDSSGKSQKFVNDLSGNQIEVTENIDGSASAKIKYQYDAFNRLKKVTSPRNEVTHYSYLGDGSLSKVEDAKGNVTQYTYNSKGYLTEKVSSLGGATTFVYDLAGNKVSETDPSGNMKKFDFDSINRLTDVTLPDDKIRIQYDSANNVTSIADNLTSVTINNDSLKRITYSELTGRGVLSSYPVVPMTYSYDGVGNRTGLNSSIFSSTATFDIGNRLKDLNFASGEIFHSNYDDLGRLVEIIKPGTGNKTTFGYNSTGLISQIENYGNGLIKTYSSLTFDGRNLITSKETGQGIFGYSLDENGQLLGATGPGLTGDDSFAYDGVGNRILNGATPSVYSGNSQQLLDDGLFTYQYDLNGNMIYKISKDGAKESHKYTYNSKNQLVTAQAIGGISGPVLREAQYRYDVLGRRIFKSVSDIASPNDPVKTYARYFVYDGHDIAGQYDTTGNLQMTVLSSPANLDGALAVKVHAEGVVAKIASSAATYLLHKDNLGSVVGVTNLNGELVQQQEYKLYGSTSAIRDGTGNDVTSTPLVNLPFGYIGRESDREFGLIYLRSRYYDPSIGRFLQADNYAGNVFNPLSVVNRYAYSSNNPVSLRDPSGYDPVGTITYNPNAGGAAGTSGSGAYDPSWGSSPLGNSTTTVVSIVSSWAPPSVSGGAGMEQVPSIIAGYERKAKDLGIGGFSAWDMIVHDRKTVPSLMGNQALAAAEHYLYAKEMVASGEHHPVQSALLVSGYQMMKLIYRGEGATPSSFGQWAWGISGILRGMELRPLKEVPPNIPYQ